MGDPHPKPDLRNPRLRATEVRVARIIGNRGTPRSVLGPMRRSLGIVLLCLGCAAPRDRNGPPRDPNTTRSHPGCLLVLDRKTGRVQETGTQSCDQATTPASTYKIPHALMGLQAGVIPSAHAIRPWNEAAHPQAPWGREDQTLDSAIRQSVVWYFQEVAQELGPERTRAFLAAFDYGDRKIADRQTRYWLDGTLRITPRQQMDFLRRFYGGELPVDAEHVETVQRILAQPVGELRARVADAQAPDLEPAWASTAQWAYKTGASMHGDAPVTWLVGRVYTEARDLLFVSRVVGGETDGSDSPAVELALRRLPTLIDPH